MSGAGPVEPGEGTRAWDAGRGVPPGRGPSRERLAGLYAHHRRAVLAGAAAAVSLAADGSLHTTREEAPEPLAIAPSQVVRVTYLGAEYLPPPTPTREFSFAVKITAHPGPPVTVTDIPQPYSAISLTTAPRPPFSAEAGSGHRTVITMHVTDCTHVPRNAGLPFLDVTLRNAHVIQNHSFILGERYARDVSRSIGALCANDTESSAKPQDTAEFTPAHPAGSHYSDRANQPEFHRSPHRVPLCITSCHNKRVTASVRLSSTFPAHA
ncbi:hypothetical protein GCM10010145_42060 [Streptomyces ruber]|uniref:Tat pathway signal sequence domain protein n=2 Tax=Streptomyces TaxID=1883 RepID=A0A918ET02_9ACTN|nr:hypothetical protein GCM10010145_42060 [Streptomyces ruber]